MPLPSMYLHLYFTSKQVQRLILVFFLNKHTHKKYSSEIHIGEPKLKLNTDMLIIIVRFDRDENTSHSGV